MQRDDVGQRLRELILQFFHAKLRLTPRSVEVRDEGGLLTVRVRGFSAPAERRMIAHPKERLAMEDYYLRLFDQLPPLLKAGIGKAGPLGNFQILLDLKGDECVFMLAFAEEDGVTPVGSS